MSMKALAITMGLGAAAGAVAIMMVPRTNPVRKLANKAACKVEDAAYKVTDKVNRTKHSEARYRATPQYKVR